MMSEVLEGAGKPPTVMTTHEISEETTPEHPKRTDSAKLAKTDRILTMHQGLFEGFTCLHLLKSLWVSCPRGAPDMGAGTVHVTARCPPTGGMAQGARGDTHTTTTHVSAFTFRRQREPLGLCHAGQ